MNNLPKSTRTVAVPEHGCYVPAWITSLCGGKANFEPDGLAYRCERCFAVVGSMGMPADCKAMYEQQEMQ